MRKNIFIAAALLLLTHFTIAQEDPYLWLEDVNGKKAMEFVNTQNKETLDKLSKEEEYQSIYEQCLDIYNSPDKIAYPKTRGEYVYNFWKDENHIRGIWRRSLKTKYINGNPEWETLLDIDKISKNDAVKWVFDGADGLYPDYDRFMISLSKGGGDAAIKKEFDVKTKSFVKDGFYIEESKGGVSYLDKNTLLVSSNFGDNTMTKSGYPRQVKLWKRGTPLKEAKLLHEGEVEDLGSFGYSLRDGDQKYLMVSQFFTFYTSQTFALIDNQKIKLDIPNDCVPTSLLHNQLIFQLKSDWEVNQKTYKQGSLVSLNFKKLLQGKKEIRLILEPNEFTSIEQTRTTKNKYLVNTLNNVNSELFVYSFVEDSWVGKKVKAPDFGSIYIHDSSRSSDQFFFTFRNFLTPTTLYNANAHDHTLTPFKSLTAYFDGTKYEVQQFKSKSKDGTLIPYFMVSSKNLKKNGKNPTLIYGYGGFESSETPFYSGTYGKSWLERGGVFVLANIRGGGEFGPKWHQAGLKEKRQNVYDDFHSVAEDLISKNITSPKHLGIRGGSNGGLLVGVAFTQRPDLYNAVVCTVPLLDMKRYNKLLAGASWMGEYGDPDKPEEWEYIKKYSPYHNLKKDTKYPEVFFYTSTRDDRVHPGHARKMAAKMIDMGYPVYFYENTEGGHGGSSTNEQRARSSAMKFNYLLKKLK